MVTARSRLRTTRTRPARRVMGSPSVGGFGRAATLVLELDRHVLDVEVARADRGHLSQDGIVGGVIVIPCDDGVRGKRVTPRREAPDVEVVHLAGAAHALEGAPERIDVDVR